MALEGAQCGACFAGFLELDAGMLVCDTCGAIAQDFAEETQEFQTGISDATFFRKEKRAARLGDPTPLQEREALPVQEGVRAYAKAVQQLLQRQVEALHARFGVAASVVDAARQLWFARLEASRILEPSFTVALETKINAAAAGDSSLSRATRLVQTELSMALPYTDTLPLLLLACWHAREPVNPLDLVRWAMDGELPYLTVGRDSRALMEPYFSVVSRGFMAPAGVPAPASVCSRAIELAISVGLECPPINAALCLQRSLDELRLPRELLPVSLTLYDLYRASHPALGLLYHTATASSHPWAHLMSVVVVAAKLVYNVGDEPRGPHALVPPAPDWLVWARESVESMPGLSVLPLSASQAIDMPADSIELYARCVRATSLSNFAAPDDLKEYQRLLDSLRVPSFPEPAVTRTERGIASIESHTTGWADFTLAAKSHGASIAAMSADYAALLTVCAAHAWVSPLVLHKLVFQLEQDMVMSEFKVAYANDETEQRRLERLSANAAQLGRDKDACKEAAGRIKLQLGLP